MIYNFLFLLSILVLQRIDFLFTSLGFFVLVLLSYYTFIRKFNMHETFTMEKTNLIYLLFILTFLYNVPMYINDIPIETLTVIITPILVWVLLTFSYDIKYKYIFNKKILFTILFIIGGILLYDFYMMFTINSGIKKIFSFANPNYTAYLILILEIFYLFSNKMYNKNNILFFVISTFLIFFTLSKTAYILQILVWMVILDKKSAFRLAIIIFVVSLAVGSVYYDVILEITERIMMFFDHDLEGTLEHRKHLIMAAFNIFGDNLLFGCGYEQFQNLAYTKYGSGLNVKTHNILLTVLAENGLIGLFLFLFSSSLLFIFAIKDKVFRKEKLLLLLIFYVYALTHAASQFFSFIPLFFAIVLENNILLRKGIKC